MRFTSLLAVLSVSTLMAPTEIRAGEIDVIRPGDQAMSCNALGAEINSLTRAVTKQQQRAASKASGGGGLGGLFGAIAPVAAPVLDRVYAKSSGRTATAAVVARDTLERSQSAAPSTPRAVPVAAPPSLEAQRLQRLTSIHTAKRC